jgi:hypothetical protein
MTPEEYTEEMILPTLREYFGDLRNRRRAMLASLTLVHLHDVLKENGKRPGSTSAFFESLRTQCAECWSVYLVAISAKHMKHNKSGFSIDEIVERPPAFFGTAVWGLSRWDDTTGGVEALGGAQGSNVSVDASLRKAFEFLAKTFLVGNFAI